MPTSPKSYYSHGKVGSRSAYVPRHVTGGALQSATSVVPAVRRRVTRAERVEEVSELS